jgi:cytochrome c peroxidase
MQDIGADVGLDIARALLNPLHAKFGGKITHADLWSYAASVVITNSCQYAGTPNEQQCPVIAFRPGRNDAVDNQDMAFQDGVLPSPLSDGAALRRTFNRMGFNDQEIVALSGAHGFGRTHKQISGFGKILLTH